MHVASVGGIALVLSALAAYPSFAASDRAPAVGPNIDLTDYGMRFVSYEIARRAAHPHQREAELTAGDVALDGWNEETIAVNPKNPMNIAYATLFELRVSTDGGTTWSPAVPGPAPITYFLNGDPTIAFDAEGRLFWSFLATPNGAYIGGVGVDIMIAQCDPNTGHVLPGYPVNVTVAVGLPASAGNSHDKQWLAADSNPGSPYANRLYLIWTRFPPTGAAEVTLATYSTDHGLTWAAPLQLGTAGTGTLFVWPTHIAVAPNGDVYAAEHRQPLFSGGAPNGTSGFVTVYRSTTGGASYGAPTQPFPAGAADMTFNVQTTIAHIPGAHFLLQGSVQPWVLPDPLTPGRIHVVANDDPDNNVTFFGDAANVYLATSTDYGATWGPPKRVDSGPGTSFQVMPTASIDPVTGAIVVQYYDNRSGNVNGAHDALLDVFAAISLDGGATFQPDFQVSDAPFDPDAGARCRWDCGPLMADVWSSTDGQAFAVSLSNHFLKFTGTWSVQAMASAPLLGIWGSSSTDVFACGAAGTVAHFDGVSLGTQSSGTSQDLFGIDGRSGSDVFAVGANGTVLHYNGGGWSVISPGTLEHLRDVWANPVGSTFIVGSGGTVLSYNGASWTDLSMATPENLIGIWGSSETDLYVTSVRGGLFHWNGVDWTAIDTGLGFLTGVWGTSATDVIAVGWGRVVHFNGSAWVQEAVPENLLIRLHGSAPGNVYAVGEHGFIMHYDGSLWTSQVSPIAPTNPTRRIGEYNGAAALGGRVFTVWCGSTRDGAGLAHDQQAFFDGFTSSTPVAVDFVDPMHPSTAVVLEAPAPNPAPGFAVFRYSLPRATSVDLSLIDVQGRRVSTIVRGDQQAGRHVVSWKRDERAGGALAAGVYQLRLRAGTETRTTRVVLVP